MSFLFLQNIAPVTCWEYVVVFLLGFGCFLIGWIFSARRAKSKYKKLLAEKDATAVEKINTNYAPSKGVRAVKTRERSGKAVGGEKEIIIDYENSPLNFDSFGIAKSSERDDLKRIKGVGPFIEQKLNAIGIFTFEQISRFSQEDIKTVTALISFFPGRIERDDWKGQAKALKK